MKFQEIADAVDFEKANGVVPTIVQHSNSLRVLMLGHMNKEALDQTLLTGKATFFSESNQQLWTKGEDSGSFLELQDLKINCDKNILLVYVTPHDPEGLPGSDSCFDEEVSSNTFFIDHLKKIVASRKVADPKSSYTASLFHKGINKVAQKVGEEAVELVIEAKDDNKDLFLGEAADLFFHYLVLLEAKNISFDEVLQVLVDRHRNRD